MRLTLLALAALVTSLACAAPPASAQIKPSAEARTPDAPVALASHRAIYDLRLSDGAGSKAPVNASGRIAFDFSASCGGYAQTLRQAIDLEPSEGERRITETRSTTFEDVRGDGFRFSTERTDESPGEVDGRAVRGPRDVSIALTRPETYQLSTQSDVIFPTQHIERIIQAARRGEKVLLARVYDGSDDGRKIFDVTTIIGKPAQGQDPDHGAQSPALRGLTRWPVAVAYFPVERRDGPPDYVLSFNLYENGVSTGLKLDYGDFVLSGELTRIEFPPAAQCGR
ncbi:cell envelope integrity EipB family protein [Rhodoblastus sp.]|jgi:hypothetical protein|uniref:cell envelope integrity EipB family protein n=1 Tax=Rhodoblastus sp. TaxID=1962975 RepID=UPI0026066163|nr:cell envelope integrity EipB family protein [Rhodoblastus sp.]